MSEYYPDLGNTTFPNIIDVIANKLDILPEDGGLISQYQTYMQLGDFANANKTLGSIANADQKLISSEDMNTFRDCILALERFYKNDIKDYTEQKQQEWLAIVNRFSYMGSYDPITLYYKNNIVGYPVGSNLLLFLAISDPPRGTSPLDSNFWKPLTIVGKKGDSGHGLTFRWEWDDQMDYTEEDVVTYHNMVWGCIKNHTTPQAPFDGSPFWELLMMLSPVPYPSQVNQPINQQPGEIWFQVAPTLTGGQ